MNAQHERIALELDVLDRTFAEVDIFELNGSFCVEVGLSTNSGTLYAVRVVLPDDYPNSMPRALIVHPSVLRDAHGRDLSTIGGSHTMHVLAGEQGMTVVCHYHPARWFANATLYKVILKVRIWLEAYECHLRTGRPIDALLHSMSG